MLKFYFLLILIYSTIPKISTSSSSSSKNDEGKIIVNFRYGDPPEFLHVQMDENELNLLKKSKPTLINNGVGDDDENHMSVNDYVSRIKRSVGNSQSNEATTTATSSISSTASSNLMDSESNPDIIVKVRENLNFVSINIFLFVQ